MSHASPSFLTTHWTIVMAAGQERSDESRRALARLCETYWYPVYAFVRRNGFNADDATDMAQSFFTRLVEKRDLAAVDRARGRFRSWLLASVKHHLANERDRTRAEKRGGGRAPVSIDSADAESRYRLEPSHELTPERVFERRWALAVLEEVLAALKAECDAEGRSQLFEELKEYLGGRPADGRYRQVAGRLGMGEGAVRMASHRLRQRYRDLLRQHIAQTVETAEQVDEEIAFLFTAVG